jgi:hypothetical protein
VALHHDITRRLQRVGGAEAAFWAAIGHTELNLPAVELRPLDAKAVTKERLQLLLLACCEYHGALAERRSVEMRAFSAWLALARPDLAAPSDPADAAQAHRQVDAAASFAALAEQERRRLGLDLLEAVRGADRRSAQGARPA